jgi:hypothetical protein
VVAAGRQEGPQLRIGGHLVGEGSQIAHLGQKLLKIRFGHGPGSAWEPV